MARFTALVAAFLATAVAAQSSAEEMISAPAVTPTPAAASVLTDMRGHNSAADAAATEYTTVLVTVTQCPTYVVDCPERKTRTHTLTVPCSEAERITWTPISPHPHPKPTEECETEVRPPITTHHHHHPTGTGAPVVTPTGGPIIAGAGSVAMNAAGIIAALALVL